MTPAKRAPQKRAPQKISPAAAREAEAEDGYVTVEHCGVDLRVPVRGKIPVAATDAFRSGDNYAGTKHMLGEEQWQKLSDAGMTMDGLDELGGKIRAALGN